MGEAACLSAAMLWALAVAMFRRPIRSYGAPAVNLVKCGIATALLGTTVVVLGQASVFADAPLWHLSLVIVSGWVGLTVGDTGLFAAVARIGPYRAMLLQTLASVFAAGLAFLWLGELPSLRQAAGAAVILLAITLVLQPAKESGAVVVAGRRVMVVGVIFGIVGAMGQGFGLVILKEGMAELPHPMAAAFLRMLAATIGLALLTARRGVVRTALRGPHRLSLAGASFMGAYLAIGLMTAGVFLIPAALAAVLLATVPLFSLFVDAVTLGERISVRAATGTVAAVLGVVVLST